MCTRLSKKNTLRRFLDPGFEHQNTFETLQYKVCAIQNSYQHLFVVLLQMQEACSIDLDVAVMHVHQATSTQTRGD